MPAPEYGLAVGSIDISSARLAPAPGADGWLCRLPGAVVWLPGSDQDAGELISACLAAGSPAELLGTVGSRLADPQAAPWPPFAIVAARGPDLVAVVHGPVEVIVGQDGGESRLYGGDDVGSWLNRLLRGVTVLGAGNVGADEGLADLREGVIRAGGFVLAPLAPRRTARSSQPGAARAADQRRSEPAPRRSQVEQRPLEIGQSGPKLDQRHPQAERPTVMGPAVAFDVTVAERPGDGGLGGAGTSQGADGGVVSPFGRLTWDTGQVHELAGAALVGRDVASDDAAVAGTVMAVVPGGQNDSMSRVHAELRARGAEVVVVDRGSTNGTFVWDEPAKVWQRLTAGEPYVLRTGAVLAFGERTATFEAIWAPTT